ncbi:MAG: FG-GAP-like repeat-containing protein, partial [Bacteroidota bacterium]
MPGVHKAFIPVIFLAVLSFSYTSTNAQMRQVYRDNIQPNNDIRGISFYTANEGFVAFSDWIGYTTDSGRTFIKKYITNSNVDYNGNNVNLTFGFSISGIKAFNANTLVISGDYGNVPSILSSSNGGTSFSLVFHSIYNENDLLTNPGITDLVFPQNNSTGYATDQDRILKTTNGGLSWSILQTNPRSFFTDLEAVDNNVVLALCTGYSSNKLLKTTNGTSFQTVTLPVVPASGKMIYAHFLNQNTGWLGMSNDDQKIFFYKTTDGGSNWTKQNKINETGFGGYKMKFINDSTGYAIGGLYNIFKTTNSGINWEPLPRANNFTYLGYNHKDIQVFSASQLWAGGRYGLLELSTNGGGTPLPVAAFEIDTLTTPGTVRLMNYSRTNYQYQWIVNGLPIGTSYNASYTHNNNRTYDTIKLVVNNGQTSDTATIIQHFWIPSPPIPDITSISPTEVIMGTEVTITGTNFTGATKVTFGGVNASSFIVVSPTTIKATVGRGNTGYVLVTTPYGSDSAYQVIYLSPLISSFTPTSGGFNSIITIRGKNFSSSPDAKIGGLSFYYTTTPQDTLITGIIKYVLSDTVSVRTGEGTDYLTGFTYLPGPAITSFSPQLAKEGDTITITGSRFSNITGVKFGGIPAASFILVSPTTIKAVAGRPGNSGFVTVYSFLGTCTLDGLTYLTPSVNYFIPSFGIPGSVIEIGGNNFSNVSAVSVSGVPVSSFTINSPTSITAVIGNGTGDNSGNVTVLSNTGNASRGGFQLSIAPVILSFSPRSGPVGTIVTIKGLNFNPSANNNIVYFGAVKAVVNSASANTLIVKVPAGATYQPVTVTTGNRTGTSSLSFLVTYEVKDITKNSFATKVKYALKNKAYTISTGDIDGDGKTDIIAQHKDSLSIFRNTSIRGNITFAPKIEMAVANGIISNTNMLVTDIDGDGKPDIEIVTSTAILVLRNTTTNGNIIFASPVLLTVAIPTSFGSSARIASGDLNGDGKPEIIVTGASQGIVYFKNNSIPGNASFSAAIQLLPVTGGRDVTIADLDADNRPEIIATGYSNSSGAFAYFKNTSSNDSIFFQSRVFFGTSSDCVSVITADINNDNTPDVLLGINGSTAVTYKNTLKADTATFSNPEYISVSLSPERLALGSINGDDTLDLFSAGSAQSQYIMQNIGSAINPYFRNTYFSYDVAASGVILADIDGDGKTDIVTGLRDSSFILIHRNTATEPTGTCPGGTSILVSNAIGSNFQWQQSTDGINFTNIIDGPNFSGVSNDTLTLLAVPAQFANTRFRCFVNGMNYSEVLKIGFLNKWTGAVSTAWEVAGNWSCGVVPGKTTDVVIPLGTVTINANDTVRSITIVPGANLIVTAAGRLVIFGNNNNGEYPNFSLIRTQPVSAITNTTATAGGAVSNDLPGTIITEKGVVWDIVSGPTTALPTKINNGAGNTGYISVINGLLPNTTYYVRAYAVTNSGTAYGEQIAFTTTGLPVVETGNVSSITLTSAVAGGNINSNGGNNIIAAGLVWGTSPNPTIALPTKTNTPVNAGSFTSTISLLADKNYYIRAYATN